MIRVRRGRPRGFLSIVPSVDDLPSPSSAPPAEDCLRCRRPKASNALDWAMNGEAKCGATVASEGLRTCEAIELRWLRAIVQHLDLRLNHSLALLSAAERLLAQLEARLRETKGCG